MRRCFRISKSHKPGTKAVLPQRMQQHRFPPLPTIIGFFPKSNQSVEMSGEACHNGIDDGEGGRVRATKDAAKGCGSNIQKTQKTPLVGSCAAHP